jgi:VWFA-related protein
MYQQNIRDPRALLFAAIISLMMHAPVINGQQASPRQPASQDDDVLRIKTELVQTDLMVFDKQRRFVDGLRPEQFELSVDGKLQPLLLFERVISGSTAEASQLSATQPSPAKVSDPAPPNVPAAVERHRVIFFFLDDLHLSEASLQHSRTALADFVENQVGPNDRVAIVSASGQIGFLQQLSDNKAVLRAAIYRLNYKRNPETYAGRTVITEYEANRIADHGDKDLFNYIVTSTINEYQLVAPHGGDARGLSQLAVNMVANRTRQINAQSTAAANDTLSVLLSLMQSSASLPGRKLVFLISDGFIADSRNSYVMNRLRQVGSVAAQAGIVVYTMDARGTFSDPAVEAGRNDFPDGMASGTSARMPSLESSAMREPLRILADDTGGRAILNSNSFTDAFQQAIDETSSYYLLAWRPDNDEQRNGKARIKVGIKDRPDLRVRLRRNYYVAQPDNSYNGKDEKSASAKAAPETPEAALLTTLGALYPRRTIPTILSVGYLNTADQGLVLNASMQIDRSSLSLTGEDAKKAEIDVIGAAIDDRGFIVTFKQVLTVVADPSTQNQPVMWHQRLRLQPGLYQVRIALRERSSGRTGSAQQWIEVPDLSKGALGMSTLFLGERKQEAAEAKPAISPQAIMVDVDHRFSRTSVVRFQTYIYNAAHSTAPPVIEIQARLLRNNRAIITLANARVPTDSTKDLTRLPYWAELALESLPSGSYVLQVTAIDLTTKATVTQEMNLIVE